jgi:pimeloyl-ACP methyl ester carboxylesterase
MPRIPQLQFPGLAGAPGQGTLVVMLPGVASPPEEFVDAGFVAAIAAQAPGATVHVLDSHYGYYEDGSILARLHEEQVLPARAAGFGRVWLVGISLGGFGALGYLTRHPQSVDGVLALAPYLGPASLHREIAAAGGPRAWAAAKPAPEDTRMLGHALWHHLALRDATRPEVHLGYGESDRFAHSHRQLAPLLPAQHVRTAPGGHDWPVWSALWRGWLEAQGRERLAGAGAVAAT